MATSYPDSKKNWNKRNPDKVRATQIKLKFGLSWDEYINMYAQQHGCCAICKTPLELYGSVKDKYKVANVDHCHNSGKVRGLLCNKCNVGIGALMDSPTVLRNAAEYLEKYNNSK